MLIPQNQSDASPSHSAAAAPRISQLETHIADYRQAPRVTRYLDRPLPQTNERARDPTSTRAVCACIGSAQQQNVSRYLQGVRLGSQAVGVCIR